MTKAEHGLGVPVAARGFQGRRAGIVTRFASACVDFVVVVALMGGLYATIVGVAFIINPRKAHWPDGFGWSLPLVGFCIALPYLTLAWCTIGRSCGDALFGLRVVSRRGERLGVIRSAVRAAFYVIFPIGLFWCAVSRHQRSVQDIVLHTTVVYDWERLKSTK